MSKYGIEKKGVDIQLLADKTLQDDKLLRELMGGIQSKDHTIRYNSFEVLQLLSKNNPKFLYSQWNQFQKMLYSKNNFHRYIAIYILANLTKVDEDHKFDDIFDDYYGILGGGKTMTASHVALNSSVIYFYKPELQSKIIDQLLNIDTIHHGKQKELVKAYVIEALLKIYPYSEDKKRIEKFIKLQKESKSPKTRQLAACFLEKCEY